MDFNELASCPTAQYFWQFCFAYIIFINVYVLKFMSKKVKNKEI